MYVWSLVLRSIISIQNIIWTIECVFIVYIRIFYEIIYFHKIILIEIHFISLIFVWLLETTINWI